MSNELRSRIILDLGGNYGAQLQSFDKLTQGFANSAKYATGVAGRAWGVLGGQVDRVGGNFWVKLAAGGAGALAIRNVADFQEQLTRLGIDANLSADGVSKLKEEIYAVANKPDVREGVHDIADGIHAIIENGGDIEFARANMQNLGMTMRATGEDGEAIGSLIGFLKTLGVQTPKDVGMVIDSWNSMRKASGLSLGDMIGDSQRLLATYQEMGRSGPKAAIEIGAALSSAKQNLGSPEKAAMALQITLQSIRENWYALQNAGVQVYDPKALKEGRQELESLPEIMKQIVAVTHGNDFQMRKLFGDKGIGAFNQLMQEFKSGQPLDAMDRFMKMKSDGTGVDKDAARAADEFNASVTALYNSIDAAEERDLGGPIKSLTAALNSLTPGTVSRWMEIGKWVGGGLLAIYGIRQAVGVSKDIYSAGRYIFTGNKGGGALAGAMGAMGGATPVFVVNMGSGMGGASWGGGEPDWTGAGAKGGKLSKFGKFAEGAGRGIAAFGVGYAAGTAIYDAIDDTRFADHIGGAIAHVMSLFSDEAADAVKQRQAANDQLDKNQKQKDDANINLKLTWDAQGNPVLKHVTSDTHKLQVDFDYLGYGGLRHAMP